MGKTHKCAITIGRCRTDFNTALIAGNAISAVQWPILGTCNCHSCLESERTKSTRYFYEILGRGIFHSASSSITVNLETHVFRLLKELHKA